VHQSQTILTNFELLDTDFNARKAQITGQTVMVVSAGAVVIVIAGKEIIATGIAACSTNSTCQDRVGQLSEALHQSGVKFSPDKMIDATRLANGRIVFLEQGNSQSGLVHILERHAADFANRGIEASQISKALFTALDEGTEIGARGGASIYQFVYSGQVQNVAIVIGSNGYIVTAHPITP
jgi:filamentous hemagglutinin